jgi:quercetin dioxygenase-like cupin family protein
VLDAFARDARWKVDAMADETSTQKRRWLIGPEDGATRFLLQQQDYSAGFFVGLHKHDGEEAHMVLAGEVRFTVDGRHIVCRAGEAAVAPPASEHGFLLLADSTLLTIREQRLGTLVIVLEPDGSRREVESFRAGPPWSKEPPPGTEPTPNDVIQNLYQTTRHLL